MPTAICCALGFSAGCYVAPVPVATVSLARPVVVTQPASVVGVPPPAPLFEQPPPEPYAGAVWLTGYWDWQTDQSRYVWVSGRWGTAPRPGVAYMPPSWRNTGQAQWYRVPGRWVAGASRDASGRHIAYDSLGRPFYF
jgi:hypothetical protein